MTDTALLTAAGIGCKKRSHVPMWKLHAKIVAAALASALSPFRWHMKSAALDARRDS